MQPPVPPGHLGSCCHNTSNPQYRCPQSFGLAVIGHFPLAVATLRPAPTPDTAPHSPPCPGPSPHTQDPPQPYSTPPTHPPAFPPLSVAGCVGLELAVPAEEAVGLRAQVQGLGGHCSDSEAAGKSFRTAGLDG